MWGARELDGTGWRPWVAGGLGWLALIGLVAAGVRPLGADLAGGAALTLGGA
ncbi:MAG: hypothetical protein WBQ18_10700 [Solirubrobacteraceae bacterium]